MAEPESRLAAYILDQKHLGIIKQASRMISTIGNDLKKIRKRDGKPDKTWRKTYNESREDRF